MKNKYKLSFWICILLLVGTNLFWLFQTIDNAVGQGYYKVSCQEYKQDAIELVKILNQYQSKSEITSFLSNHDVKYTGFDKGEKFIVQLNSVDFTFAKDGKLIETNQN